MQTLNIYYENYEGLSMFIDSHRNILFAKDNRSVMVQVFCGICDKEYLASLSHQIKELVPHVIIVGSTTSGEIMNGKVSTAKVVLSFSVFKYTDVKVTYAIQEGNNSFELGRSIVSDQNSKNPKLLILFSSGKTVNANQMLMGIQSVNPHLPIAGGVTGYNNNKNQGFVFCNDIITDCGVVGVLLEGESLSINQHTHLCWQPIGKEMTITKAEGLRVYTIDNIPACQIYRKYLGVYDKTNIINSIFPLMVQRNDIEIVKTPSLLHDDDSIEFFSEMVEGEKVRLGYGHVDMIIQSIDKLLHEIEQQPVESIFVYSCSMRREFLQDSIEIETLPFQKIAPIVGFFTHGEFYHHNNINQLLNLTMTTLTLAEVDQKDIKVTVRPVSQENESYGILNIDNVKSRNVTILKALTNLVNTVTNELCERTAQLEAVNKNIYYTSIHDPLTGIYNRGFYEDEIKRLDMYDNYSLGIIICDVDGLKLINDTLGHSTGDIILKAVADILKSFFNHDSVIARIGGDEFSVLLHDCSQAYIQDSCQQIQKIVTQYNTINPIAPLSLSIGFSYSKNVYKNVNRLFKEADNNMYREKLHRSNSIRSDLVQALLTTLEARDILTEEHGRRLQKMIVRFAEYIHYSKSDFANLQLFARFHDIGKVGIPDNILFKPDKLLEKEKKEMQRHCEIGFRIAQSSKELIPIADLILEHHEWWNGNGYPIGLQGEDIPIECRILAIVDAYDAMTSDRPYRKALSNDEAVTELERSAGTQFDPSLIKKFICMLSNNEIVEIYSDAANI